MTLNTGRLLKAMNAASWQWGQKCSVKPAAAHNFDKDIYDRREVASMVEKFGER